MLLWFLCPRHPDYRRTRRIHMDPTTRFPNRQSSRGASQLKSRLRKLVSQHHCITPSKFRRPTYPAIRLSSQSLAFLHFATLRRIHAFPLQTTAQVMVNVTRSPGAARKERVDATHAFASPRWWKFLSLVGRRMAPRSNTGVAQLATRRTSVIHSGSFRYLWWYSLVLRRGLLQ